MQTISIERLQSLPSEPGRWLTLWRSSMDPPTSTEHLNPLRSLFIKTPDNCLYFIVVLLSKLSMLSIRNVSDNQPSKMVHVKWSKMQDLSRSVNNISGKVLDIYARKDCGKVLDIHDEQEKNKHDESCNLLSNKWFFGFCWCQWWKPWPSIIADERVSVTSFTKFTWLIIASPSLSERMICRHINGCILQTIVGYWCKIMVFR